VPGLMGAPAAMEARDQMQGPADRIMNGLLMGGP